MVKNLTSLLGSTEFSPEQEAGNALRRLNAGKQDRAYNYAMDQVGNQLEYASSSHLFAGFVGLLTDAITTLWEPARQVINSPYIRESMDEQLGKGVTIPEYFKARVKEEVQKKANVADADLEKALKGVDYLTNYANYQKNIASYAAENGISCDDVLANAESQYAVIKKTFGSVEAYTTLTTTTAKESKERLQQLKNLGNLPLEIILPVLVASKFGVSDLKEFGIDIGTVSGLAKSYLKDISLFGSAFIESLEEQRREEVEDLQECERNSLRRL